MKVKEIADVLCYNGPVYLKEEYSYLRNSEVDSVYVSRFGKVVITIK